jgi:CRISPR system Cascade subunit CasC
MLIQVHILQNYAPSNLNRDDNGSPKAAMFGGFNRGRISSQCLKRSVRRSTFFEEAFEEHELLGKRTRDLPKLIDDELKKMKAADDAREAIVARVPEIGQSSEAAAKTKDDDDKLKTRQLIFLDMKEIPFLAEKLLAVYQKHGHKKWTDPDTKARLSIGDITKELGESIPLSVDIAMFGRMTTSGFFKDVQASVQVAHTLTTHSVDPEFDYFTAVDDLQPEEEIGASMIGDVEFNSATHYKYFNVQWEELVKNLKGEVDIARQAVLVLLEAAAFAQPTGKQNTFAAHNLPDVILVEVSQKNLPVSYANAFLKPVGKPFQVSLMDLSVQQFNSYRKRLRKAYGLNGQHAYMAVDSEHLIEEALAKESISELQDWLTQQLPE